MSIMILFHLSGYRCFKQFYLGYVHLTMTTLFPKLMSYSRMVIAMQYVAPLLCAYFKTRLAKPTGISFIDSTSIKVCHNRRIVRNKVFAGLAKRGKTTMGWFYGFKLHLIINHKGELLAATLTQGDVDDRKPVPLLAKHLYGTIYADKGYLSAKLADTLLEKGISLITNVRRNMKEKIISVWDKAMLSKRFVIETVNDILKNSCQIEHTRHRSSTNFITNLLAGLIAYTFLPHKPKAAIQNTFA